MHSWLKLLLLVGIATLSGCISGPFRREIIDNRPADRTRVASVGQDGVIELEDGRRVRLFGLGPPSLPEARDRYRRMMREASGLEVSVLTVLPGEPAAVMLDIWEESFGCGFGLRVWDPFPTPLGTYTCAPFEAEFIRSRSADIDESDLEHRDADPGAVMRIRNRLELESRRSREVKTGS